MSECPILFNGEMVRAILDGRKTQTRRVIKPEWLRCLSLPDDIEAVIDRCPYGQPGDRLWVRERCKYYGYVGAAILQSPVGGKHSTWRTHAFSDHDERWSWCDKYGRSRDNWCPSILMPRWASRIDLEVTAVRVERVQEIRGADAIGEGVDVSGWQDPTDLADEARDNFAILWNSINTNRGYSWESNPWVWVVEFRRLTPPTPEAGGE